MTVPVKVSYTGDTVVGRTLRKLALTRVGILKNLMSFQGLLQYQQVTEPFPGVTITAKSVFGIDTAVVHVEPGGGEEIPPMRKREELLEWFWYAVAVSVDDVLVFIASGGGGLSDIDVDGANNVYVVGYARTRDYSVETSDLSNEATLLKYNTDGQFSFRQMLTGGTYSNVDRNESGTGVAIDTTIPDPLLPLDPLELLHGGVYVLADFFIYRDDFCYDNSLVKFEYDGTVKWKRRLSLGENGINDIFSWGVDTDSAGNAVVAGHANIYNGNTFHSPWDPYALMYSKGYLISFAYDGDVTWSVQIGDPLPDVDGYPTTKNSVHLYAIDVAPAGDIVVCGSIHENTVGAVIPAGLVVKLDSDGVVLWKRAIEGFLHKRDDTLALYGDANTGLNATGCGFDTDGSVYVVSLAPCDVATNSGFYHYHLSKIASDGTLQWQRFFEVEYFDDSDASLYAFTAQIAVGNGGVYVICPRFPNAATPTLWGSHILMFSTAGDLIWQRLLEVALPAPFTSYSGIVLRSIKAASGAIYLAGQVVTNVASVTMKLPGVGLPVGTFKGLVVTDPGLTIYSDDAAIPIHEDAGSGETTPAYEISFLSEFTLNTAAGFVTVSTPTEGAYTSPLWGQTNTILKKVK